MESIVIESVYLETAVLLEHEMLVHTCVVSRAGSLLDSEADLKLCACRVASESCDRTEVVLIIRAVLLVVDEVTIFVLFARYPDIYTVSEFCIGMEVDLVVVYGSDVHIYNRIGCICHGIVADMSS